jgi:hypothetical protein
MREARRVTWHHLKVTCGPIMPHQQPRQQIYHVGKTTLQSQKKNKFGAQNLFWT